MKMLSFLLLFLFISGLSASSYADDSAAADYCYKPGKPLFFSTANYKIRYDEDVAEYERCQKHFIEMKERVARLQQESMKKSQMIWDEYNSH